MRGLEAAGLFALLLLATGCADRRDPETRLAEEIERQVQAARPDFDLSRYVRIYAHEPGGRVKGIFKIGRPGVRSSLGMPGTSTWVAADALPVIMDGGCGVLHVAFDPATQEATVDCGAVA